MTMTLAELLTQEISNLLDETFEQVNGYYLDRGTSLFETLATISPEEASRPVSETCASIAGQVEHVRFYLELMERYMRGEEPGQVNWDHTWLVESVSDREWAALIARLKEQYRSVRAVIAGFDDWMGTDHLLDATLSTIVHTAYHLGEIRQALCTVKS